MAEKYIPRQGDVKIEKKRMANFEAGNACGESYKFHKKLEENQMIWVDQGGYGRIVHTPTGFGITMEISPSTTGRHKCYNLDKLKERVQSHLTKSSLKGKTE